MLEPMRRITQTFGVLISHTYLKFFSTKQIYQGPLKAICVPFVSCYECPAGVFSCPVGTLQHYMVIRQIPFVEISHLGIFLIAVGRMGCGWLCPFGLFQDLMYKIKCVKKKIPKWVTYFRWPVLIVLAIGLPFLTGELWFCKICASGTLEATIPWSLWNPINPEFGVRTITSFGIAFYIEILIFTIILYYIVTTERPFCKVLCPLSIIFSVFNKLSIVRMHVKNPHACSDKCGMCKSQCPMDLRVSDDPNSGECIRCLKCMKCKKVSIGIGNLADQVFYNEKNTPKPVAPKLPGLKPADAPPTTG